MTHPITGCRARLGNTGEDIEVVPHTPTSARVFVLDGYDVYASAIDGPGSSPAGPELLFDLYETGMTWAPRGIAYDFRQKLFVFNNPREIDQLYFVREDGELHSRVTIAYPDARLPYHSEGLAWVPKGNAHYPEHLLMATIYTDNGLESLISVLTPDGKVVDQIRLDPPFDTNWLAAVCVTTDGRLLVTQGANQVHAFDFDGHLLASGAAIAGSFALEGLGATNDGRIVAGDYFDGTLHVLDAKLNEHPEWATPHAIGLGVSFPFAMTWDASRAHYVVEHLHPTGFRISSIAAKLDRARELFTLDFDATNRSALAWLPERDELAVLRASTDRVEVYARSGELADTVDLSALSPVYSLDYVPSIAGYVVVSQAADAGKTLYLTDRKGLRKGAIQLQGQAITQALSVAAFEHQGKPAFLVADTPEFSSNLVAFDRLGRELWRLDYRHDLGVVFPSNLTWAHQGPFSAFAVLDSGSGEIRAFSAPH